MTKQIKWRVRIERGILDYSDIDKTDLGFILMGKHNSDDNYVENPETLCRIAMFIGEQIRRQGLPDSEIERCITHMHLGARPRRPGFIYIPNVPVYHNL